MCLTTVDRKTKRGRGYGYKAFDMKNGKPTSFGGLNFPEEEWFTDPNTRPIENSYPAGFHICRFKKDALGWDGDTTRKVFYADVVASGRFLGEPVFIARQIWIPKEEI